MEPLTGAGLWDLIKHIKRWLTNLNRAGKERKAQSIEALRSVIVAARSTGAYIRQLRDTGRQSHEMEAKLSEQWTRLGFLLSDLGLNKLAKRCDINGRYWSDPDQFEEGFIEKADVGLESMEKLARQLVADIE